MFSDLDYPTTRRVIKNGHAKEISFEDVCQSKIADIMIFIANEIRTVYFFTTMHVLIKSDNLQHMMDDSESVDPEDVPEWLRREVRKWIMGEPNATPLANLDVSAVTSFHYLFSPFGWPLPMDVAVVNRLKDPKFWADPNNQLGNWQIGSDPTQTITMSNMFNRSAFNQDISKWNVSRVTNMVNMFESTPFNQDISKWNVSNVTNMNDMFASTPFNQDISEWDVSSVTSMEWMFVDASNFNQPLDNWNVSNVRYMYGMFEGANAFNQPIGSWNVSNVINMSRMFENAKSFNQPLRYWEINENCVVDNFLHRATSFHEALPKFRSNVHLNMVAMDILGEGMPLWNTVKDIYRKRNGNREVDVTVVERFTLQQFIAYTKNIDRKRKWGRGTVRKQQSRCMRTRRCR